MLQKWGWKFLKGNQIRGWDSSGRKIKGISLRNFLCNMATSFEISCPGGWFHPSFRHGPIPGTLHASNLSISSGLLKKIKIKFIVEISLNQKKWLKNEVIFKDFNSQKWDKKIVEIARFVKFSVFNM
jgi:hypothetical protein